MIALGGSKVEDVLASDILPGMMYIMITMIVSVVPKPTRG